MSSFGMFDLIIIGIGIFILLTALPIWFFIWIIRKRK